MVSNPRRGSRKGEGGEGRKRDFNLPAFDADCKPYPLARDVVRVALSRVDC